MDWVRWISRFGKSTARPAGMGCLQAIYVCAEAGMPMQARQRAEAVEGRGLRDDRYFRDAGFWKVTEACQVTLIADEDLGRAQRRHGIALMHGQHRRNLVVSGIPMDLPRDTELRIGEAILRWWKPRPPCGYLESLTEPGMMKGLGRHSGVCLKVEQGGRIAVGDPVAWNARA